MAKAMTVFLLGTVIFLACAHHIRKEFVPAGTVVDMEEQANYLPEGWSGITSANYPGALAIVGGKLIFDRPGPGSRPWMKRLDYIVIELRDVKLVDVQDEGAFGKKVVRIATQGEAYHFLMKNAESVAAMLKNQETPQ